LILIFNFCAGDAFAQPAYTGREPGYSASKPAVPYVCKTKEEIAWDLMMYGIQTVPPLRARIKDYDDLLDAYRRALRVVRGQDQ
jgi:hypothetical protein